MGFFYPYSAIAGKRIPSREDFVLVRDEIMKKLRDPSKSSIVLFAGVYGSVIPSRGDHTRRSDIDVFLVYPARLKRKAKQLMRDVREIGHRRNVVVNGRTMSRENAKLGNHPYGPSFRRMWKKLADEEPPMMVGDPAKLGELLHVSNRLTVREEMEYRIRRHYKRSRRHLLEFLRVVDDPRNLDRICTDYMQRVVRPLHLYLNIARKMFLWKDGKLDDDRKAPVLKAFAAEESFHRMHRSFHELRRLDREYDQLLEEHEKRLKEAGLLVAGGQEEYTARLVRIMTYTFAENMRLFEDTIATLNARRTQEAKAPRRARNKAEAAA